MRWPTYCSVPSTPSGKLPFTFPCVWRLQRPLRREYPGEGQVVYRDGIFVGYRWIEKERIEPLFAFGHGLSYTTFDIANVRADRTSLATTGRLPGLCDVTNTGGRAGAEVVQLYIGDKLSSLPRPVKELKGFEKVYLAPGQSPNPVTFEIDPGMLACYDDAKGAWVAEPGEFTALCRRRVGRHPRNRRFRAEIIPAAWASRNRRCGMSGCGGQATAAASGEHHP